MTDSPCARSKFDRTGTSVRILLAALAMVGLSRPAVSQQDSATSLGIEMTPRGHREVNDITYGNWKKFCFRPGGGKMICRTSITGTFATGQMAIRLDIIEHENHDIARLQLFAPIGMYLPNAVKITVDQGGSYRAPYTWCLANACIAGTVADPDLLKEMTKGHTLRLEFLDSNLLTLTASVPLDRFTAVNADPPTQIFEQDIDE